MLHYSSTMWLTKATAATLNVKGDHCVRSCLLVFTKVICFMFRRLYVPRYLRRFWSGAPAMSATAGNTFCSRFRRVFCHQIILPMIQIFLKPVGKLVFASLMFFFSPLSWCIRVRLFVPVRLQIRGLAVGRAGGALYPLSSSVLLLVEHESVMKLFDDSLVELKHALLVFKPFGKF